MSATTAAAEAPAPDGRAVSASASGWEGAWIVIPAYNEQHTIRGLAEAVLALCPRVIVVDDGSSDATVERLAGLPLVLLRHPRNQGKAASLRTAFGHAMAQGADCVVTLDGDGQHDPADAIKLLDAWRRWPDRLVMGARLHDKAHFPPARYAANRAARFCISWAAGHPVADSQSGYRVYSRAVMALATGPGVRSEGFAWESEVIIEAAERGHPTLAVRIPGRYPVGARASHYRAVADSVRIGSMVAGRLFAKGLHPLGLWRSLGPPQVVADPVAAAVQPPR